MADSFNGVPIFVLATDVPKVMNAFVTERHVPYSQNNFVDLGGAGLRHIVLDLLFKVGADAITFEAQNGVQGTLVCFEGTYTAILTSIRRTAHGVSAGGEAVLACDFLIVSSP